MESLRFKLRSTVSKTSDVGIQSIFNWKLKACTLTNTERLGLKCSWVHLDKNALWIHECNFNKTFVAQNKDFLVRSKKRIPSALLGRAYFSPRLIDGIYICTCFQKRGQVPHVSHFCCHSQSFWTCGAAQAQFIPSHLVKNVKRQFRSSMLQYIFISLICFNH